MTRKTYCAHVAPLRHDDPRRATQAARAEAAKAAADALRDAGLNAEYRGGDLAAMEAVADRMREALRPVCRDVYFGEVTSIPLQF
jgi:hypothetical protein